MKENNKKIHSQKEKEFDIIPLLKELMSKLWLILLVGLIAASAAYGVTKMTIAPIYRCGFTAYVNNQHAATKEEKDSLTNSDIVAAQQLTKTYSYIIRSNSVLSESLKTLDTDLTRAQFSRMVSTEIKDGTELISIYVVNEDPQTAYELANAIANAAPACMSNIVEGSSMKIVDYPEVPTERYGPSYMRYALLGFLFGSLFVLTIVIIRFIKNDSIDDDVQLESRFSIPVLGVLPDVNQLYKEEFGYHNDRGYKHLSYETAGKEQQDESK